MAGQLLALVAFALLAAQLVNMLWLYRAAEFQEVTQAATGGVLRAMSSIARRERIEQFRRNGPDEVREEFDGRRRFGRRPPREYSAELLIPEDAHRYKGLEKRAGQLLSQNDVEVKDVVIARANEVPLGLIDNRPRRRPPVGPDGRERPIEAFMLVAVQVEDGRWMHAVQPMRKRPYSLISTIITQTLILYIIVLLPLIWFSRRLAKPLRELTAAAQRYLPGQSKMLVEAGPPDTRQLIAAFNAMQARVDAMLDEKDVMLGAIGHDLRTPLAALRVRVESVESDEEREQMVRGIEDIDRTLDDILSLARVGRAGEHLEPTDLAALVETIVSEFDDLGEPVSVTASARAVVPLRETMIRRALRNLISNAVKYGGKAELSVEQFADRLAVHIDDGGPGLPDAQIERMFEPFQRAEASRNRATGGSGLGLTLARAIARDHGGEVRLSNRAGGGLRASLILPLAGSDRASV